MLLMQREGITRSLELKDTVYTVSNQHTEHSTKHLALRASIRHRIKFVECVMK